MPGLVAGSCSWVSIACWALQHMWWLIVHDISSRFTDPSFTTTCSTRPKKAPKFAQACFHMERFQAMQKAQGLPPITHLCDCVCSQKTLNPLLGAKLCQVNHTLAVAPLVIVPGHNPAAHKRGRLSLVWSRGTPAFMKSVRIVDNVGPSSHTVLKLGWQHKPLTLLTLICIESRSFSLHAFLQGPLKACTVAKETYAASPSSTLATFPSHPHTAGAHLLDHVITHDHCEGGIHS